MTEDIPMNFRDDITTKVSNTKTVPDAVEIIVVDLKRFDFMPVINFRYLREYYPSCNTSCGVTR